MAYVFGINVRVLDVGYGSETNDVGGSFTPQIILRRTVNHYDWVSVGNAEAPEEPIGRSFEEYQEEKKQKTLEKEEKKKDYLAQCKKLAPFLENEFFEDILRDMEGNFDRALFEVADMAKTMGGGMVSDEDMAKAMEGDMATCLGMGIELETCDKCLNENGSFEKAMNADCFF